ncbi:MAG: branched-chain amino acid ABC transporter substrate-binding protein, partial [Anaerolineae bacterium]
VMAEGIKRVLDSNKPITGENLKAALETISNFETGGVTSPLTFSATDHAGNKALRLYQVKAGKWEPISDFIGAK